MKWVVLSALSGLVIACATTPPPTPPDARPVPPPPVVYAPPPAAAPPPADYPPPDPEAHKPPPDEFIQREPPKRIGWEPQHVCRPPGGDCPGTQSCKDRGDGQYVCMGSGDTGHYCLVDFDCSFHRKCYRRLEDDLRVCK
jgi:hypothetical protein